MNLIERYIELQRRIRKNTDELLWAQIWSDTQKSIPWLGGLTGISPGRWAVGYNYIYVMTRILNELRPHSVLDLGLGISSSLFSSYFTYYDYEDGIHTIVESSEDWIDFYSKQHSLWGKSEIINCRCIKKEIDGSEYNAFDKFEESLIGRKYSVISIDAPVGSEKYSRRDIIPLVPEILEESFVIVIDDSSRPGEKKTIDEICKTLEKNNIDYCSGIYRGESYCCVIASEDNRFFCSL